MSYKLGAEEVLLASGGFPETSALCGNQTWLPRKVVRYNVGSCWKFITENWSFPSCGGILEKLERSQQKSSISDILGGEE